MQRYRGLNGTPSRARFGFSKGKQSVTSRFAVLRHQTHVYGSNNIIKVYRNAPGTAKMSIRTGVYISCVGISLFVAPRKLMNFLNMTG